MGQSLEQKKAMVQEVSTVAQNALTAVSAEYRGLTAQQMDRLRAEARERGVYLRVVKNTLAKRAVAGTEFECLTEALDGPLLLAFSQEDPGAAARLIRDFSKDHNALAARNVVFGGTLYAADQVERLASLPTREEALSKLMATMRAPVQKLATTMNEVPGKLVRTLAAVRDAKQGA
ncbi:50S ribosomal protein L10 [Halorhodospira halochloris]|uniref:Large ribosomal subunit protein uL10 n=1 Tax=Halorhodospira halochloris TaxID=1052 RepID=A0A125T2T9_HALHR|nr:50S ribosomal protein L10 [Halorhodospira halochloris]MBK1652915.1 50S ribosomal protein L10 [Halorhodospira halochloris]MCG5530835.1 50S ribosomal protein L10 [Halorhodospira halochloris]MCG5549373.1 50S ribosomal protein L10 [Halorhodospira halochloris]BAU58943.1 LSU ribosomal protein L10p [Halorhodospira halochloris]